MSSAAMVASSQRPIPLRGRADLVVALNDFQGVGYWVIKDPVGLKYHRLQAEQYRALRLLDSERSLEQIRDELHREFPTMHLTLPDVQNLITDLHKKGLVQSNRTGQGATLIEGHRKERRKRIFNAARNLLYMRLPGWDPERTLTLLYPLTRWIFRPWAIGCAAALVLSAWTLLAIQFDHFHSRLPEFQQFFGWPNLIYMWVTLGVSKVIHEFGHGLSCKHYGGECHEMGVMLLVFSPCLYCDVSDSWMLRSKWQRIIIAGAGMYIEVILSAIAIFVWWNTDTGLLHHLSLNVFFVTTITTVIFNANPLMRFDGYYMMSDLLEIPNLRPKADKLLREQFAWHCLGIEPRPDPFMPETGKFWFFLFAIAAWLYRWVILFGITIFLYTVLKPYGLQSLGIVLALVSMGSIFFNMGNNLYKVVSAPRIEPLSYIKITISLVVFFGLTAGLLSLPIPWHLESSFLIEPRGIQHVYNQAPGALLQFHVQPGDVVQKNQVVAVLENRELEDERRQLEIDIQVQDEEVELQQAVDDLKQLSLAREKRSSLQNQLRDVELRLASLSVRAPCNGTVVAPPPVPESDLESQKQALPRWSGSPMQDKNSHCFLQERTHLLSIAPNKELEAVLLVDQSQRNDMSVGEPVELKFSHVADKTYHGTVKDISQRHIEFAPQALSNKSGGDLSTVTDQQGRERLTSIAYQATVVLQEDQSLMLPGLRGRTRFLVDRRTAGEWIWRYLRQTFHFKL